MSSRDEWRVTNENIKTKNYKTGNYSGCQVQGSPLRSRLKAFQSNQFCNFSMNSPDMGALRQIQGMSVP
jgi:hypothetical protein